MCCLIHLRRFTQRFCLSSRHAEFITQHSLTLCIYDFPARFKKQVHFLIGTHAHPQKIRYPVFVEMPD